MEDAGFDDALELYRWELGIEDPLLLDWTGSMRVRPRITDAPERDVRPDAPARNTVVFGPPADALSHPDRSVDIVVLESEAPAAKLAEARRVARDAIFTWSESAAPSIEWLRTRPIARPEVSIVVHGPASQSSRAATDATTPSTNAIETIAATTPHEGAAEAQGELLVFVGDGAQPQRGWLRPLTRTLRDAPDVGAVGGLLVSPTGAVAAAGGVVFADGSAIGFGSGSPDSRSPLFRVVRDVPYVPASLLATRAGLLARLGGFDSLGDAEYAAVDLGLRMHAAGRRVVYHPQSVAVVQEHEPGAAPRLFTRRWAARMATLPARPEWFDAATWDRLADVT